MRSPTGQWYRTKRVLKRTLRSLRRPWSSQDWHPRWIPVSESITVASEPPTLRVDRREEKATQFISGLRSSLQTLTAGWSGPPPEDDTGELIDRVRSRLWYHTIELPGGILTPGMFDHRPLVPYYGIPDDLHGKRALDIGTWDGFWAFEYERRGATVTAIDVGALSSIDYPPAIREELSRSGLDQRFGGGFELARSALGSSVNRIERSVYELDPADIGTFDIVQFADVLMHLEAPTRALQRVRSVTREKAIVVASFDPTLVDSAVLRYQGGWNNAVWWTLSRRAIGQMIIDAGFSDIESHASYRITQADTGRDIWEVVIHARA